MSYTKEWIAVLRYRNLKSEQVFQAIEDARRILSDLEQLAVLVAEGKLPDIGQTAHLTHGLRGSVDRILVGIVESAIEPTGGVKSCGLSKR